MARVQLDPSTQSFAFDSDGANAFVVGEDQYNVAAKAAGATQTAGGGLLPVKRVLAVQQAMGTAFNALGTAGASSADITVTGAQLGDIVLANLTSTTARTTVSVKGFVKAANTVTVTAAATTAGPVDISADTVVVVVLGLT